MIWWDILIILATLVFFTGGALVIAALMRSGQLSSLDPWEEPIQEEDSLPAGTLQRRHP